MPVDVKASLCLRCRRLGDETVACPVCGGLVHVPLEQQLAIAGWRALSRQDRETAVLGTVLLGGLSLGTLGGVAAIVVGTLADAPTLAVLGLVALMICPIPLAILLGMHHRSVRRPRRASPALALPALALAEISRGSRLAFAGRLEGDGVVVRAVLYSRPHQPGAPFAWMCATPGFTLVDDDGQHVRVPAGPLVLDLPAGHPRVSVLRALHPESTKDDTLVTTVELPAGQRVRLEAEVEPDPAAPADGYRDGERRLVTRGLVLARPISTAIAPRAAARTRGRLVRT
jgi:hypothetical protein